MKTSILLGTLVLGSTCMWAQSARLSNAPSIAPNGTVNAADYSRAFAPGAIVTIFGDNLANSVEPAAGLPLPNSLGGATVELIDGENITALPLFFASPGQLNAQLPYTITGQNAQIRVRTVAGDSNMDSIALSARAPRVFSVSENGTERAIIQAADASLVTKDKPLVSGGNYSIYVNSLGATVPAASAGSAAGSGEASQKVMDAVSVTINGTPAKVTFAGLAPGFAGLYQLNFEAPYDHGTGDVPLAVSVVDASSQAGLMVPIVPNGFYFVLTGGKLVNGQNKTTLSGLFSPVAFRNEDQTSWGSNGYRMWTTNLELTNAITDTAGLALTLRNGASIVYDNNGIETGTQGNYYNNSFGTSTRIPDASKAGLYEAYCMSNYLPASFAGFFRLTAPTTFTQIIGYFDPNGTAELRFNPADPNFKYRMNIFSNDPMRGDKPKETGSFTGDVFSSDSTAGTFAFSATGAMRVFSDGATDGIDRMVYTLSAPFTLQAGDYWFEHDAAVPFPFKQDLFQAGPAIETTTRSKATPAKPKSLFSTNH
ncbi:MAG: hypothetical protein M3Y07_01425 [Acidobacteriota bacterium]|nr:hypothetical protein [Acidobacteriota bacterium]